MVQAMVVDKVIESGFASMGVKNPKQAKNILYVAAGVILVGSIALIIRRQIKKSREMEYGGTEMEKELDSLDVKSSNLTITGGEATLIAQNLLAAMNKYGTDEQAIYDNLNKCKTADDLNLVIQKFGSKPYMGTGLASTYLDKKLFSTMKNLVGWLRAELNRSEEKKVKAIFDNLGVPF